MNSEEILEKGRKALLAGRSGAGDKAILLKTGEGARVWDQDDKEYIDCTSQAWSLNLGYQNPEVLGAVKKQLEELTHVRTSFDTEVQLKLSAKLSEIVPGEEDQVPNKVTYCLHGSTAMEAALKLALKNSSGEKFVSLWDGYHGRTLATLAASWPHPGNDFLPFMDNFVRVPQAYCYRCPIGQNYPDCGVECANLLEKSLIKAVDGHPAAVIMEPVQGNGGMIDYPTEYYQRVRDICDRHDVLLIWDEIQTAFGRLGEMTAAEHYGVTPDVIVFGKAVGGGFPLAGTLSRPELEPFDAGDHAFTFGHFPLSMAAALKNIKVIENQGLLKDCQKAGEKITEGLQKLQDRFELIGDIRGPGLMIGVELVKDKISKEPARKKASRFIEEGLHRGVIFGGSKYQGLGNIVKIKPPLVITDSQITRVLEVFEDILKELTG